MYGTGRYLLRHQNDTNLSVPVLLYGTSTVQYHILSLSHFLFFQDILPT